MPLFDDINVKRRYTRSVNLERDLEVADSVKGYILAPKAQNIIDRFIDALITPNAVRAWTITGVYGTGKSAFAHFLTSLCSAKEEEIRKNAVKILKDASGQSSKLSRNMPDKGFIKAIATAQREPIANTLIRALKYGSVRFWAKARGQKGPIRTALDRLYNEVNNGKTVDNGQVLELINGLASSSKAGMLIVIDELGKNLEYASQGQAFTDLYLLQQIAELPSGERKPKIFFIGLLHQAFYEYSYGLAAAQRNEWIKIQGRFEDIPLSESPDRLVRLISSAIDHEAVNTSLKRKISSWGKAWARELKELEVNKSVINELSNLYPFHPSAAMVLPVLCNKFSQNDRTLFTFLASDEPHSFKSFLKTHKVQDDIMPTLKVHRLYDYFIESSGITLSARPQLQRWVEIQGRIDEASSLEVDAINMLKTVGILNLVSSTGALKASPRTVRLALCDSPSSNSEIKYWGRVLADLKAKGFVTYRQISDELRIWEGTDFDIEKEVTEETQRNTSPLAHILTELSPLKPLIARRHSYVIGTTRYFERYYLDSIPEVLECKNQDSDGIICYLTLKRVPQVDLPAKTSDGKPIIFISAAEVDTLRIACNEYIALSNINKQKKELQSDGVARREVRQRLFIAEKVLRESLERSFDITNSKVKCWNMGEPAKLSSIASLNTMLSDICDKVYSKAPELWNELINRRELTSQGAKARRELIEAMLERESMERLGISGNGPEYSMYMSVLKKTGVHSPDGDKWKFHPPHGRSGVYHVWKAIEEFCVSAKDSPVSINELYDILHRPPYGVKQGIIPVLLLAVLSHQNDYLSVYIDGSFIPVLGAEHFELLVKKPELFSVRYFEITGLKKQVFEELSEILSASKVKNRRQVRNLTLLSIINPLVKFVQKLPKFTLSTENISDEAKAVRDALLNAKDPDILLFNSLPQACGVSFIDANASRDNAIVKSFRKKLIKALQELQSAYDNVLAQCKLLLCDALSVKKDLQELREYLSAITNRVNTNTEVIELNLKRFIQAAINKDLADKAWLESLLMVISDKPVASWSDKDIISFEVKLGDIIRRFKNIEAIIDLGIEAGKGFEAKKVTIAHHNGEEFNEVLWIEPSEKESLAATVKKIKNEHFNDNDRMNKALLTAIIEAVLDSKEQDESPEQMDKKEYGS